MFNPATAAYYPGYAGDFQALPQTLKVELLAAPVHSEADIEALIIGVARESGGGLISAAEPFKVTNRSLITSLNDLVSSC